MLHKISDLCDKVDVMYKLVVDLRRMKYDVPKEARNEDNIRHHIENIQALAGDITHDKSPYQK